MGLKRTQGLVQTLTNLNESDAIDINSNGNTPIFGKLRICLDSSVLEKGDQTSDSKLFCADTDKPH